MSHYGRQGKEMRLELKRREEEGSGREANTDNDQILDRKKNITLSSREKQGLK